MDAFLFTNVNMSNGYPSQQRWCGAPVHQQSQYTYQQVRYHDQQSQYHHLWQQVQQPQYSYRQLPYQPQESGYQYQQQQSQNRQQWCQQQFNQHSHYHQQPQYHQQQQQQQYPVDYLMQMTDLTNLDNLDIEPVQTSNVDILPIQVESGHEPLQSELQQQQPIGNLLICATQDVPIEIDDDIEELTEESVPTPTSQHRRPTTPQPQETPSVPALKKPENSFFTEFYGEPDKDGKIKRLSIESILRKKNVRMSTLNWLTGAKCVEYMRKEDLARATKLAKQRKAKESGLANPVEDEELVVVEAVPKKKHRIASSKRKSANIEDEDSSNSEPASKIVRVGIEQEQIAAPITPAASSDVLAPGNGGELTDMNDALFTEEETVPEYGDMEIDETSVSNEIDVTAALPSVEAVFEARPISGEAQNTLPQRKASEVSVDDEDREAEEDEEAYRARLDKETYIARAAAELEAELEEEEEMERPRSPSVSSDEDEGDNFIGNLKYKRS